MDEKTRIMISLGAATAANCIPCFQHLSGKAYEAGITDEEIKEAANVGVQVKRGAELALRETISNILGDQIDIVTGEGPSSEKSCCG